MRVVIVGGGTAGHMALAHVSNHWPDVELVHIFDSRRPTIGVGEGTTPDFIQWLGTIGISFDDLVSHCNATRKRGLSFEGWGKHNSYFEHEFLPRSQQAVHFSAAKLPELLASRSKFSRIDDSVQTIETQTDCAIITTEKGQRVKAGLVIDARGFPRELGSDIHSFDWVTTDSALVTKTPTTYELTITRSIARKFGWVFCIPLRNETSFGYVYNSTICTQAEVKKDFDRFLNEQNVSQPTDFRCLKFPNFVRGDVFDGHVFHIGNCASFLEPLEATAIGVIVLQLQLLLHWREQTNLNMSNQLATERINRIHEDTLLKISVFIAWHYSAGSQFETPFWQIAADRFHRLAQEPAFASLLKQLYAMQNAAAAISPITLAKLNTEDSLKLHFPDETSRENFGGYSKFSFAQIGSGLGWNQSCDRSDLHERLEKEKKRA
ncbi:MAG: tryptophan 7-halogenase [Mariniblastus sp.]